MSGPAAVPLPGTAVAPRRRSLDDVITAAGQPVPGVSDQGSLVDHWHETGLLDRDQVDALGGEQP